MTEMADGIAQQLVDMLYAGAPVPAGCRVNHARGVLVEGRFRPTVAGRSLSRAPAFFGPDCQVLARFSSSTADPDIHQDDPRANPRGLALRIGTKDGIVLVGHSVEAFPASTPEEFLALLQALNAAADHPEDLDSYMRGHAPAGRFEVARSGTPTSFAAERYHFLHPYRLTDEAGRETVGRLHVAGAALGPKDAAPGLVGPDCLDRDLRRRLSSGRVELLLQFEQAPEIVDAEDVSAPWPSCGNVVVLGRILLEQVAADQGAQRLLTFDPAQLPIGVAFAGDRMVAARLAAYRIAFQKRTQPLLAEPDTPAGLNSFP